VYVPTVTNATISLGILTTLTILLLWFAIDCLSAKLALVYTLLAVNSIVLVLVVVVESFCSESVLKVDFKTKGTFFKASDEITWTYIKTDIRHRIDEQDDSV
jgi:hypothetical protein